MDNTTYNTEAFLNAIRADGIEHTLLHSDIMPTYNTELYNYASTARFALRRFDEKLAEALKAQP